ncbi:MAG: hypothetical protein KAS99_02565 [Candidatus Omnitrophica bacterium]|nr:hypothetical protein [Candidatus Omnitrophota bacterium]
MLYFERNVDLRGDVSSWDTLEVDSSLGLDGSNYAGLVSPAGKGITCKVSKIGVWKKEVF